MSTSGDIEARLDRVELTLRRLEHEVDEVRLSASAVPPSEPAVARHEPDETVPGPHPVRDVAPEPVPVPAVPFRPPTGVTAPAAQPPRRPRTSDRALAWASIQTDFQRGHTALSTLLGLGALAVYVIGLARDHRPLRIAGLTLFGLALAKLFLYDLSSLSSITRALSFLALGAVLLAAAFFAERVVRGDQTDPGRDARIA